MSPPSGFLMTWMIENILSLLLATGWIFLFPKSKTKESSQDAAFGLTAAILTGIVIIEFIVLRASDPRRSIDSAVENLIAAVTMTIVGPIYIAIIGSAVAKYFRPALPLRTIFNGIAIAATVLLMLGYWYARHRY